jgi:hypothetical protein
MRIERRMLFRAKDLSEPTATRWIILLVDAAVLISGCCRRPTPNVTAIERMGHRTASFFPP